MGLLPAQICTETQNRQSHPKGVPSLSVPQKDHEISHPNLSLPERPPAHPDVTPQTSLPEPHLKAPPCRVCTVWSRHRLQGVCGASIQALSPRKMGVVQPPAGCARPRKQLSRARGSGMRARDLGQVLDLGSGDWPRGGCRALPKVSRHDCWLQSQGQPHTPRRVLGSDYLVPLPTSAPKALCFPLLKHQLPFLPPPGGWSL